MKINEIVTEDLSRRGFLKGLGAAAVTGSSASAAAGEKSINDRFANAKSMLFVDKLIKAITPYISKIPPPVTNRGTDFKVEFSIDNDGSLTNKPGLLISGFPVMGEDPGNNYWEVEVLRALTQSGIGYSKYLSGPNKGQPAKQLQIQAENIPKTVILKISPTEISFVSATDVIKVNETEEQIEEDSFDETLSYIKRLSGK